MLLKPMQAEYYSEYARLSIAGYAEANIDSGRWEANGALERATREHHALLPEGQNTRDHFLFELWCHLSGDAAQSRPDDGQRVGILWLFIAREAHRETAFIYDIELFEQYRGNGLGRQAMQALEVWCVAQNISQIKLNVFAFNKPAIGLYESLGFETTNFHMQKNL